MVRDLNPRLPNGPVRSNRGHPRIAVLHVATSFREHDGISETVRLICNRLDPSRFRFGLCAITDRTKDVLDVLHKMPIEIHALARRGAFFDPRVTQHVRRIIRKFGANIVHTHNNKGNLHGRLAAWMEGTALVTTHHDLGDIIYSRTPELKRRSAFAAADAHDQRRPTLVATYIYPFLNIALNRLNDQVIGVSNAVCRVHSTDPGDPRFTTVYAPYDDGIFRPTTRHPEPGLTVLGTVGRLARCKGHETLLHAVRRLHAHRRRFTLKLIGEGPLRGEIETFVRDNALTSVVELLGHRSHDAELYEGLDICVQPSLSEGCSISLLEAMACGIPVIASNIEGPRELIIDGKTGLLVPPKNPGALAAAIEDLMDDPERAGDLARHAAARVRARFSTAVFADKIAGIYVDVSHERNTQRRRPQTPGDA